MEEHLIEEMSMPALVVNERVVSMGRVLKVSEIEKIFYDVLS